MSRFRHSGCCAVCDDSGLPHYCYHLLWFCLFVNSGVLVSTQSLRAPPPPPRPPSPLFVFPSTGCLFLFWVLLDLLRRKWNPRLPTVLRRGDERSPSSQVRLLLCVLLGLHSRRVSDSLPSIKVLSFAGLCFHLPRHLRLGFSTLVSHTVPLRLPKIPFFSVSGQKTSP